MEPERLRRLAASLIASHRALGVDQEVLAQVLGRMRLRQEAAEVTLYEEGARAETVEFLLEGRVRVLAGDNGELMTRLQAPAVVGHLGVLTGLPRSATVITDGPALVGRLEFRELWALVGGDAAHGQALRRLLLASLANLESQTNARLIELVHAESPAPARTAASVVRTTPLGAKAKAPAKGSAIDELTAGFDADLLAQADQIEVVETEAARRERYRR